MPRQWDRSSQLDEDLATAVGASLVEDEHRSIRGQAHDRIHGDSPLPGIEETIALPGDNRNVDVDVELTAGQKMLSAMSGSLLTSLLVTPLDVVRVRLQSQPSQSPLSSIQRLATRPQTFNPLPPDLGVTACCREVFFMNNSGDACLAAPRVNLLNAPAGAIDCAVEETQKRTFTSTFDGLKKIARHEGITTLWRGLSPTLVMTVPGNIIYFTGYDWLRFNKQSPINRVVPDSYGPLVAGSTARILAAMVVSPIEMFRTRMQASSSGSGHFAETLRGVRDMVSSHGYFSLWRGLSLTLWRDVPFSGIYWYGYETIRGQLTEARERGRGRSLESEGRRSRARSRSQSRENHTNTFIDSFTAGALSGSVASILTMPFDVGKTRRQVFKDAPAQGAAKVLAPEEQPMLKFLWHIFKQEGVPGLWKGWVARTLKVAPACAIMISSYEIGKRSFRSVNERAERKRLADS
ncbi:mitochondrial carrier domain-containing protein [Xylogone sp. PMI_703]|nr:mitochondrial carrier domain-containing protein [Xylogone sp. PMI_703]